MRIVVLLLLIFALPLDLVKAEELQEITSDVEIRYKWYKEIIEGKYYPKKEKLDGYLEDNSNIKYGLLSSWNEGNCNLSDEYYMKEYDFYNIYNKVVNVRYVKLENFNYDNNIKIYQNTDKIDYEITFDNNDVIIDLKKEYFADTLIFYIKYEKEYKINLYVEKYLNQIILSKNVIGDEILIPDETWITNTTQYETYYTSNTHKETGLTKKVKQYQVCRFREIYTYKYKINKEYYDDDYHDNIEGYIKDIDDYKIFYKGVPLTTIIEVTKEKIVKDYQTEYVYIQNENNDSSTKLECQEEVKTKVEYREQEIFKVPKKIYIIIVLMILIIMFLIVKLYKKNVV